MTILGIDYGEKRVGIALSDTSETLAFPKETFESRKTLLDDVVSLVQKENARIVVLGLSQDLKGNDNPVMEHIRSFKKELETRLGIPVVLEAEFWSSAEARRFQGKVEGLDASAAAIILQRFLDKQRSAATN
ncbi:MAG: Holliday junction resolvase RuvX [Patescibacteria group bacterium]